LKTSEKTSMVGNPILFLIVIGLGVLFLAAILYQILMSR
jgi:hypothetical protein